MSYNKLLRKRAVRVLEEDVNNLSNYYLQNSSEVQLENLLIGNEKRVDLYGDINELISKNLETGNIPSFNVNSFNAKNQNQILNEVVTKSKTRFRQNGTKKLFRKGSYNIWSGSDGESASDSTTVGYNVPGMGQDVAIHSSSGAPTVYLSNRWLSNYRKVGDVEYYNYEMPYGGGEIVLKNFPFTTGGQWYAFNTSATKTGNDKITYTPRVTAGQVITGKDNTKYYALDFAAWEEEFGISTLITGNELTTAANNISGAVKIDNKITYTSAVTNNQEITSDDGTTKYYALVDTAAAEQPFRLSTTE